MKSLTIVLSFVAVFGVAAYIEHIELESRLDAEAEYKANARELAADYGDEVVAIYQSSIDLTKEDIESINKALMAILR